MTFALHVIEAVTGSDPWADLPRTWKTERASRRQLVKLGFRSLTQMFYPFFEEIEPAFAGRGDVGVAIDTITRQEAAVVFTGTRIAGMAPHGLTWITRAQVSRAFKV